MTGCVLLRVMASEYNNNLAGYISAAKKGRLDAMISIPAIEVTQLEQARLETLHTLFDIPFS